jgi:hypothetical protein
VTVSGVGLGMVGLLVALLCVLVFLISY